MSQPQTFNERYEHMRGTPAPPAPAVEVVEPATVVDIPDGKKPEGVEPAKPAKPQAAEAKPAKEAPPAPAAQPKQEPPKKTVEQLETENRELQARLAAKPAAAPPVESKPAPAAATEDVRPSPDKYPNGQWDEKYIEDVTRWAARDEHRKQQTETQLNASRAKVKERFDAYAAKDPKFNEVKDSQIPISPVIQTALVESEHGPELFVYLATHEAEAREISALQPWAAARRIAAIEATFTTVAAPAAPAQAVPAPAPPADIKQSRAPRPISTVRPSSMPDATTLEDINKMPPGPARNKAFMELRAKQGQKDARRLVATR